MENLNIGDIRPVQGEPAGGESWQINGQNAMIELSCKTELVSNDELAL